MNTTNTRLNAIFSDRAFLEVNKDLHDFDSIYAAVVARESGITRDELSMYLSNISKYLDEGSEELSEEQLEDVAGGSWEIAAAVVTCVSFAYHAGYEIGKWIKRH